MKFRHLIWAKKSASRCCGLQIGKLPIGIISLTEEDWKSLNQNRPLFPIELFGQTYEYLRYQAPALKELVETLGPTILADQIRETLVDLKDWEKAAAASNRRLAKVFGPIWHDQL